MATDAFTPGTARQTVGTDQTSSTVVDVLWMVLTAFASLKLTVVLLCFSIALVLIGTLAQAYEDVWSVVDNYFRTERAYVPFQVFFPPAWFPNMTSVPGGFWFPGGYTIGTLMGINLLAAHGMRFKIQATGTRLWAGLGVIALGCVICGVFITIQQESESLTSIVTNEWNILWSGIALAAGLLWATATYRLFAVPTKNPWDRWVWASAGLVSGLLFCYLVMVWFQEANAPLSGVYTRILWQLIKAFIAASVLLVGCTMVFRKRGGIVLLHAGLMLMMANELVVENWHIETQTSLAAGDKANWTQDIRTPELAIIDNTDPKEEKVVIVPKSMLDSKQRIKDDRLPFDLQVVEYMENSTLIPPTKDTPNRATAGNGLDDIAVAKPVSAGASASSSVNTPSAYVDLFEKGTDKKIGTYLLSTMWMDDHAPERVKVGDNKVYDLSLRFKRYYKPYSVEMLKASKDNYIGTDTPRNYSSDVRLIDPQRGVDRKVHISMNNPFRYGGETFYQSGHTPAAGGPISTLSVVKNGGWMIPYLGCMIVFVGMAAQFGTTLRRFTERKSADQPMVMGDSLAALKRKVGGTDKSKKGPEILKAELAEEPSALIKYRWAFSVAAVLLVAAFLASKARTPSASPSEMDLYKLGQIPVIEGGRLKPFDSLARESLSQIADRQTYIDAAGKRQPAIRWLLDVIAKPDAAQQHKIFRIHNREVLALFGITSEPDARVKIEPGGRYSLAQLLPKMEEFDAQLQAIQKRDTPSSQYSTYEKKMIDLNRRFQIVALLLNSFDDRLAKELVANPDMVRERPEAVIQQLSAKNEQLRSRKPPLVIPGSADEDWVPYSLALEVEALRQIVAGHGGQPQNEATAKLAAIFDAYGKDNPGAFNAAVNRYHTYINDLAPKQLADASPRLESFFSNFEPFYYAAELYVIAMFLALIAWLFGSKIFASMSFWIVVFTFVVHSAALVLRMYIAGRPPVTNLYASAVFIAWACVGIGLILEMIFHRVYGTIVASVAGFSSLFIAHLLATQVVGHNGDTIGVQQAVLDTNFWLATHVVCITIGYATTFLAGILGILYILGGVFTRKLIPEVSKDLGRMIYGTLCGALLFSFFGTVLGGLWGDDSWGRFWGWDPKENGALIIVLWNAVVLHARWGGMVKDRGMAVLAVGGNIVTAWSWFGVNELGIGLHSYGFTEGVLVVLGGFVGTQLLLIGLGSIPKRLWRSFATTTSAA